MMQSAVRPREAAPLTPARTIKLRTRGHQHGPIVRLVSPSDLGELIKPFVFLDHVDVGASSAPGFGFHPHSGIATLTLVLDGGFSYEDSTGATGTMSKGSVEWMQAGGGVWHRGKALGQRILGYQLWVALPPEHENGPPCSQYVDADQFHNAGPARVILGTLDGVTSPIAAPSQMNYLDVRLKAGQSWRYEPPPGHDVVWLALHEGQLTVPDAVGRGELVIFERAQQAITLHAGASGAAFVLGSAPQHPHPLVMGSYSVHTSRDALVRGEAGISAIAAELRRAGKL